MERVLTTTDIAREFCAVADYLEREIASLSTINKLDTSSIFKLRRQVETNKAAADILRPICESIRVAQMNLENGQTNDNYPRD